MSETDDLPRIAAATWTQRLPAALWRDEPVRKFALDSGWQMVEHHFARDWPDLLITERRQFVEWQKWVDDPDSENGGYFWTCPEEEATLVLVLLVGEAPL